MPFRYSLTTLASNTAGVVSKASPPSRLLYKISMLLLVYGSGPGAFMGAEKQNSNNGERSSGYCRISAYFVDVTKLSLTETISINCELFEIQRRTNVGEIRMMYTSERMSASTKYMSASP